MRPRIKASCVWMTVAAAAAGFWGTNVLSNQIPDCANSGGSTVDQHVPCLSCFQDQNGDWKDLYANQDHSCSATVWNASVTVDTVCGSMANIVLIPTQNGGTQPLMAFAIPTPLTNATCVLGVCNGTQGVDGAGSVRGVNGTIVCPAPLPPG
jgi:hypothetical protein